MWGSGPSRLVPGAGAARWPSLITATMARCIRRDAKAAGPIVVHDHRLSPVDRRRAAVIVDQGPGSGSVVPDGRAKLGWARVVPSRMHRQLSAVIGPCNWWPAKSDAR